MTTPRIPIEERQPVAVVPCPNPYCKKPVIVRLTSSGKAASAACQLKDDGCGTTVNFNPRASKRIINEFEAVRAQFEGGDHA